MRNDDFAAYDIEAFMVVESRDGRRIALALIEKTIFTLTANLFSSTGGSSLPAGNGWELFSSSLQWC